MSGIDQVSDDFVNELKILACFDPANMSLGIKLRSDMSEELCLAAQRLHQQGMISAVDGGYLTPFGMTMLEHLQHLLWWRSSELSSCGAQSEVEQFPALSCRSRQANNKGPSGPLPAIDQPLPARFGTGCALISLGCSALPKRTCTNCWHTVTASFAADPARWYWQAPLSARVMGS